jgi:hypothetical protein
MTDKTEQMIRSTKYATDLHARAERVRISTCTGGSWVGAVLLAREVTISNARAFAHRVHVRPSGLGVVALACYHTPPSRKINITRPNQPNHELCSNAI